MIFSVKVPKCLWHFLIWYNVIEKSRRAVAGNEPIADYLRKVRASMEIRLLDNAQCERSWG